MRLGQLSRKLDLSTSKIVTFIEKEFEVTIENHPNTKIDDNFLEKIEAEFKVEPKPVETPSEPVVTTAETDLPASKEQDQEALVEEPVQETKVEETSEVVEKAEVDEEEEIELIKAPKPELKQIKVLRKIELPQKKKVIQEDVPETTSTKDAAKELATLEKELKEAIEKPAPVKRKKSTYKRPNKPMKKKKSVEEILAEKKKREEQERLAEEKKKQERAEYEKKKRKEHYSAQVANVKPKKKKKKKQVETATKQEKLQAEKDAPKTWIGKLVKWFQTS